MKEKAVPTWNWTEAGPEMMATVGGWVSRIQVKLIGFEGFPFRA
jgi:hypothetical protein